jgi:urease accessory protein
MKVKSVNHQKKTRFIDIAKLEPKKENIKAFGIMDDYDIMGNVYILLPKSYVTETKNEINVLLNNLNLNSVIGGCTKLPDDSGLLVRLLGQYVFDIKNIIYLIIGIIRKKVLNISFSKMRKI